MATERFDVIIIGGGNAGFGVSAAASEAGKSIAFIEERDFGGTCPNRGCTPKKVLVAAAHSLHEIEQAHHHGITVGKPILDWSKLIARKDEMIGGIPGGMAGLAEKRGTVFRGHARFSGPNTVTVDGTEISGDAIVIATGSKTRPLPIPGADLMITSDEVLSETEQPGEVVFIGGGVIAMEFSHVYARAGTRVTILEAMPQLLPRLDGDAVAKIREETERLGVTIHTGVKVRQVAADGGRLTVTAEVNDATKTFSANRVVNGAGRVANVDTLDLDAGNVAHDGIRVETDASLRSVSNPAVWVCGDALVTSPQLSPVATYEGRLVGRNIVEGGHAAPDLSVLPSCVYTVPAFASVGLTEAEAKEKGLDFRTVVNDMTGWFSGRSYAESVAWSKLLIENGSEKVLGAHIVGHHGEELIHLIAFAMKHGISADGLKDSLFAFPTFASDLKNML